MPLLDHFHPPLHGPRRWEGFHHSWATFIAQQLNLGVLPDDYFAESEISLGPEFEIDVATIEEGNLAGRRDEGADTATVTAPAVYSPPRPRISVKVEFAHLDTYEVRVYRDLGGGAELRAAIELVSPRNKDRPVARRTFAAKCGGYLRHGIGLVIADVVTSRKANLHEELFEVLEAQGRGADWEPPTGLYAVAYRPVPARKTPRVEAWPEPLALGQPLPVMPLWLMPDLCVPVRLEESYLATCRSLRIRIPA